MPYIPIRDREKLDNGTRPPSNPGELNYKLTRAVLEYVGIGPNYATYSEAIGALECAKLELYRRRVAPYENEKMVDNGDVYPSRGD